MQRATVRGLPLQVRSSLALALPDSPTSWQCARARWRSRCTGAAVRPPLRFSERRTRANAPNGPRACSRPNAVDPQPRYRRIAARRSRASLHDASVRQLPGDRPAGNIRGTRSVAVAPQRHDRDQPGAGVGRRPQGAAGWRQRHRRRHHRRRRARRRRAVDERHRRRSLRDRLRREDEDAARARRERPIGVRGDARGVRAGAG